MQKACRLLMATLLLGLLAGCQYFQFPGVHKIAIQQGNIVTQDMIDQLKPGMTRRQVRYVMGNPLIEDTFSPDRWDYFYSMIAPNGDVTKERVSIYFKDDQLSHFSGDFIPSNALGSAAE
jgi:outer membrane protein assembly factor BamE